jgi:hypothetical protein
MTTLPVDPIYTGQVGSINLNYDQTIAGIGYEQTLFGQEMGFDAAGNLDPSNPYSVAMNLQRRYQQGQRGTTNSMASQGQLYSGAHQRNLDEGTYQYGRSYDSARRDAQRGYLGFDQRRQQATFQRDTGLGQADAERLGRLDPQDAVPPPDYNFTQEQWGAILSSQGVSVPQQQYGTMRRPRYGRTGWN